LAYCSDPRLLSSPTEQHLAFEHLNGDEDTPPEYVRSSSPALWSRYMVTHLGA